jgi:hypothetical protein
MTLEEQLAINPSLRAFIDTIVGDKRFLLLKDAFVAHTPAGDKSTENSTSVCQGMYLGTRHVFNEMERISRQPKIDKDKEKKKGPQSETDPDLQS